MMKNTYTNGASMTKESYNGWTNYETWRIQLEVIDGLTLEDFGFDLHNVDTDDVANVESLAEDVESYVEEIVTNGVPEGLARDLALSFINRVDWFELAEHLIADAR
jgi:hypothetical protein